jgi:hypothetical protein
VLQPQYRIQRNELDRRTWPPERVLVSFGGTDPARETEKVLRALSLPEFAGLTVTVAVGTADRADEELRELVSSRQNTELAVAVPSLAPYLAHTDLAIGASGAGTWERLCLGVPGLIATTAPHQSGVTEALASAGLTRWVGLMSSTDEHSYRAALRSLSSADRPLIPPVVDGFGAARLAECLLPSRTIDVSVRPGRPADAPAWVGLQGETGGDGPDLLDGPAVWVSEAQRYSSLLESQRPAPFIVDVRSVPLGGGTVSDTGTVDLLLHRPLGGRNLERPIVELVRGLVANGTL